MTTATDSRMANLAKANEHRSHRARVKKQMSAGQRKLHRLLADPPPSCASARIFDALQWAPKIGRVKANRVLFRANVKPHRELGALTAHERTRLLLCLNGDGS